ncbi:helix-turn-helix domain-containing protein [Streptantibioticus silvisoli]|uniref:Helix-turn-helix domain-containing protein n=1 Tax=Streptantibioticus silvisoli TaxID=2705255 RepID=A0ABT6W253_9ACTN|nr:helix-turn-helix domain-containing protein [Streptantibioticus silvisoli]MDI5964826.1 helix-turn-helix domain-containing protein [Streptantibioticus silvisoli]
MPQEVLGDVDDWVTPQEASRLVKVTVQTLANWRARKTGPAYKKISPGRAGRVRYSRQTVLAWINGEREPAA